MSMIRRGVVGTTIGLIAGACLPDYSFTNPDAVSDATASADGEGGAEASLPMDGGADRTTMGDVGPPDGRVADAAPFDGPADTAPTDTGPGDTDLGDAGTVSLQDCILLMHMDEPSWMAPGDVKDSSGQGNHGTAQQTATTSPDGGKFGGAGYFDGNGYVVVPNAPSLQPTTALTYTAWVYPTMLMPNTWPYPGVIAKRISYTQSVAFTMFIWNYNAMFADIPGGRYNTEAGLANDQWYHLAIVYDGNAGKATLYINGEPDPPFTADPTFEPNDADLTIAYLPQGAPPLDPNGFFIGKIDEVAIWRRALSESEIRALAHATGPL
jgi:hypothetical protein